ncbi:serine/threonine-protein kinase AFC3 isoform X2 [Aristolochia californica]|uniref:serine/threonine-protein kinase AFC3 isoform X2 n=1 Tax=Aristolochia californica TaxID=171875 RepID=UPI0035DCBC91
MVSPHFEGDAVKQQPWKRARVERYVATRLQPPQAAARSGLSGDEAVRRPHSPPWREDDRNGHYVFDLGENLTPRYKILSKMGEGTFGRVLECWDREKREHVAIKVVRSIPKYRDAAMHEIDVLQRLAQSEKGRTRCLQMRNWFDYRNHISIVCEKLGPSLFDFLRRNKYCPFPVDLVREFGHQLLESVAYMHDLHLIHTDLKPENILLVSSDYVKVPSCKRISTGETYFRCLPKSSAIKLIDFGSTVFGSQVNSSIVSTRHYRAPEVILGLGWTYPCDIWSVGCILVELCTGEALFQTHANLEHLAMMERVLGPLPARMIQKVNHSAKKYFRRTRLDWPERAVSRHSIQAVKKLDQLKDIVFRHVDHSRSALTDLLYCLLKFEPSQRLTAHEALNHPFFRNPI